MRLSNEAIELVETSARLKKRIVKYFKAKESKYMPKLLAKYGEGVIETEDDLINAIDWFVLFYRFRNGDTFIDRYVQRHKIYLN